MTFHNRNVYAARRRARIAFEKKKKEEGRKRKKIPSANCIFIRGDIFTATLPRAGDARREMCFEDAPSGEEVEEEDEEEESSDRRSSKLAAERYTSQTRIMLFYERAAYLPTYQPYTCTYPPYRRPLSCGKLSRRLRRVRCSCSILRQNDIRISGRTSPRRRSG